MTTFGRGWSSTVRRCGATSCAGPTPPTPRTWSRTSSSGCTSTRHRPRSRTSRAISFERPPTCWRGATRSRAGAGSSSGRGAGAGRGFRRNGSAGRRPSRWVRGLDALPPPRALQSSSIASRSCAGSCGPPQGGRHGGGSSRGPRAALTRVGRLCGTVRKSRTGSGSGRGLVLRARRAAGAHQRAFEQWLADAPAHRDATAVEAF